MARNVIDILRGVRAADPVDAMSDTAAFGEGVLVAGMVLAAALAAGAVLRPDDARPRVGDARRARADARAARDADLELGADGVGARSRRGLRWARPRRRGWPRWARSRTCSRAVRAGLRRRRARGAAVPRPVQSGGSTANLLVPLYVIIGAGAVAWLVPRLAARHAGVKPAGAFRCAGVGAARRDRALRTPCPYADDSAKALEQVVFFGKPFALLFALLRGLALDAAPARPGAAASSSPWRWPSPAIGFSKIPTRGLLLNPKVIASNQVEEYSRVQSLFFDPNIYGRFLAVVMIVVACADALHQAHCTGARLRAGVLALLWAGLVISLSQSSFGALLLGLAGAGVAALRRQGRRAGRRCGAVVDRRRDRVRVPERAR